MTEYHTKKVKWGTNPALKQVKENIAMITERTDQFYREKVRDSEEDLE